MIERLTEKKTRVPLFSSDFGGGGMYKLPGLSFKLRCLDFSTSRRRHGLKRVWEVIRGGGGSDHSTPLGTTKSPTKHNSRVGSGVRSRWNPETTVSRSPDSSKSWRYQSKLPFRPRPFPRSDLRDPYWRQANICKVPSFGDNTGKECTLIHPNLGNPPKTGG